MTHQAVTINQRIYNLACEPSKAQHLQRCADYTNQKLNQLGQTSKATSEVALMAMTLLTLADEIIELKTKLTKLEETQNLEDSKNIEYSIPLEMLHRLEKISDEINLK